MPAPGNDAVSLQWFKDFLSRPKIRIEVCLTEHKLPSINFTVQSGSERFIWLLKMPLAAPNSKNVKQPFTGQFWLPEAHAISSVHLHLPPELLLSRSSMIIKTNATAQLECYPQPRGQGISMYQSTAGSCCDLAYSSWPWFSSVTLCCRQHPRTESSQMLKQYT